MLPIPDYFVWISRPHSLTQPRAKKWWRNEKYERPKVKMKVFHQSIRKERKWGFGANASNTRTNDGSPFIETLKKCKNIHKNLFWIIREQIGHFMCCWLICSCWAWCWGIFRMAGSQKKIKGCRIRTRSNSVESWLCVPLDHHHGPSLTRNEGFIFSPNQILTVFVQELSQKHWKKNSCPALSENRA